MNRRWRIVLVDDHAPSRAAVADVVGALGGTLVGVGTLAAEAPPLVERHRPDVLILAIGLPDGDGVAAARAVDGPGPLSRRPPDRPDGRGGGQAGP